MTRYAGIRGSNNNGEDFSPAIGAECGNTKIQSPCIYDLSSILSSQAKTCININLYLDIRVRLALELQGLDSHMDRIIIHPYAFWLYPVSLQAAGMRYSLINVINNRLTCLRMMLSWKRHRPSLA